MDPARSWTTTYKGAYPLALALALAFLSADASVMLLI